MSLERKRFASKLKADYAIRRQRGHMKCLKHRRTNHEQCTAEQRKVYVGFDVSQKTIEIFCICGEKSSNGSVKIVNSKSSIQEFLSKFQRLQ